jgi:adenosine kinase
MFDGKELTRFIEQATWVTVNDYESEMLQERTGLSAEDIADRTDAYIVTLGAQGARIRANGEIVEIPAATPREVKDPTGCGDAFRAGLIYGLQQKMDWPTIGRIASLMGAIKIEHTGTQNHRFTLDEFFDRYEQAFGSRP